MRRPGGGFDRPRGRLLGYVVVLFAATALASYVLSFFTQGPLQALSETPINVRAGFVLLMGAFVLLVWQEHRRLGRLSNEALRHEAMESALHNRLKVVDSLLDGSRPLATPVSVDDVLNVLLECAVDAAGAESGTIDSFEQRGDDLAVMETMSTNPRHGPRSSLPSIEIPLAVEDHLVGLLTLNMPKRSGTLDEASLHSLERFSGEAARLIEKAKAVNREKASAAYLEASNLVKSRFLTTISHELRTPLTSIIGYSKTLDNHWSRLEDGQKREFVREIEKQGNRLCRLVERILEAARVELQGVVIEPVLHDVRHSVQKALAPFMATEADRLKVGLPPRPIEAEIDPFVVDQVLSNLVDNALRYTKGEVRVSLDCYRSSVTISVSDNGEGIDPKQLNLVLEPLYRIDENVQSGTGLGLHIVRTLVESHGGRGEIRSGSTGTSIAIKLPRTASSRISGKVADPTARAVRAI
ncbi:MAG TPA: HAMP domain-containing sensor histidine kinase [Actinomycetota bacterium]|nr:HAMP domain-containing sensor histidine kinase [Actinomycetota bacterium]